MQGRDDKYSRLTVEIPYEYTAAIVIDEKYTIDQQQFEKNWRAALQGDAIAQCNLAILYFRGDSVKKDDKEAFVWLNKATLQGSTHAEYNLGLLYEYTYGIKKDMQKAIEWVLKAAMKGHAPAISHLQEWVNSQNHFMILTDFLKDKLITKLPAGIVIKDDKNRKSIDSILKDNEVKSENKLNEVLIAVDIKRTGNGDAPVSKFKELIGSYAAGLFKPNDQLKLQPKDQETIIKKERKCVIM